MSGGVTYNNCVQGGAIYFFVGDGSLIIQDSTFERNEAINGYVSGSDVFVPVFPALCVKVRTLSEPALCCM